MQHQQESIFLVFKAIVDHSNGTSIEDEKDPNHQQMTNKDWKLAVEWRDGSTSWESLADLKESFPIEVDEYAITCNLEKEPAFWCFTSILRRRERQLQQPTPNISSILTDLAWKYQRL